MVASQSRDPSLFAIYRLMETGLANIHRIDVYWKPVTAHFLEISQHNFAKLRIEGCRALLNLIQTAFLQIQVPPANLRVS